MLTGAMIVWFVLTGFGLLFVVWDSIYNGVTSWVQRIAWILVSAFTGPVGVFLYFMTCRRPFPGAHDQFTHATWKQATNSEMHCLAGDAVGVLFAAIVVSFLQLTNGLDAVAEYVAGFISGLFIFQALMMRGMYDGSYAKAVEKTFFAEAVSMNFVMAGMLPVMLILDELWPTSVSPGSATFWFRVSLASIAGLLTAYPINYWLVSNRFKHGCMTLPGADEPAPGHGHRSPEKSVSSTQGHEHSGQDLSGTHQGDKDSAMGMPSPSQAQFWGMLAFSVFVLAAAIYVTDLYVPIKL